MTTMAEAGDQGAIIDFAMAPRINSESRWLHRISRLYSCAGNEDELFSALLESILAEAETDHGFLALIEDGALRIAALRGAAASRGSGTNRLVLWAMEQSTVVLDGHIPGSPSPDSILAIPFTPAKQSDFDAADWRGCFCAYGSGPLPPLSPESLELFRIYSAHASMAFENALLRRRVAVDTLTGVYRRHYLWKRIQAEWCRSLRHHRPLSIAMIDIDGFKKINDRRGHIFGDQVLRATARTLQRGIRREDLLGRYGGDEFLLSLPETDSAGAQIIVERLRTSVQSRGDSTVSIGVCSYPNEKTGDVRGLLELADVALLRAKSEGKNRVCVYERV